jgi:hypothetical protein
MECCPGDYMGIGEKKNANFIVERTEIQRAQGRSLTVRIEGKTTAHIT